MNPRRQLQLQRSLQSRIEGAFRSEITKAMREAAQQFAADGSDLSVDAVVAAHDARLVQVLTAAYRETGLVFGNALRRQFKKDFDPLGRFEEFLIGFIQQYGGDKIKRISATTRNQVRQTISAGTALGESTDTIARTLRDRAPVIARVRANVIARTEIHTASQFGQQAMAEALEIQLVKLWVTVEDDRVRDDPFDHVDANGQRVGLHDDFIVSGEALAYPGDPAGSPGNVINCRCAAVYEAV